MPSVFLCSDEPGLSAVLARSFRELGDFALGGSCASLSELQDLLLRFEPDVLLIDLAAGVNASDLGIIRKAAATAKTVLWVRNIPGNMAFQAVSLGVRGILRRKLPLETLLRCLSRVDQGELWFDTALTDSMTVTSRQALTPRESEAVSLLAQGLKNREIATAMGVAEGTVKVYVSRLFRKLGVRDRFELALFGLKSAEAARAMAAPARPTGQPFPTALRTPVKRISPLA